MRVSVKKLVVDGYQCRSLVRTEDVDGSFVREGAKWAFGDKIEVVESVLYLIDCGWVEVQMVSENSDPNRLDATVDEHLAHGWKE